MTAREVAIALGCCYHTVLSLRKRGELPASVVAGQYRFAPDEVRAYIDAQKGRAARESRPARVAA
jgi:excisionase family DNA binding protein